MEKLPQRRWLHIVCVVALLTLTATLAFTSLVRDSVTYDETSHLAAGFSYLRTGDYRLAPDHPPLGKIWCAWPLCLLDTAWLPPDDPAWLDADVFTCGRQWLFERNDGQRFIVIGRGMMVLLLILTGLITYALARDLLGPQAALLTLTIAALSPTLLAHGRLVTTDLPITFCLTLTLFTFARLMQRMTWPRLVAAAAALTAAAVTKFSWPLVLPALLAMGLVVVFRRKPAKAGTPPPRRGERAGLILGSALFIALFMWAGLWATYGFRRTIVTEIAVDAKSREQLESTDRQLGIAWEIALRDEHGRPRTGLVPLFLNGVVSTGLVPDAYLLGLAQTLASTSQRYAYLMGAYSVDGWWYYFPVAFVIKTPIATMLLLLAGVVALFARRMPVRDPVLLAGLLTFGVVYAGYVCSGGLNIGQRHLLPLYPVLFVFAGAAAAWSRHRIGRWLLPAALVWLLAANVYTYPNYLSYFNELIGGPRQGYRYLADSNIDWGQDLLRLKDYDRRHSDEPIKLAYFGSAVPTYYVPNCSALPSMLPFEPEATLDAGLYVVSVTQLLGVYDPEIRDRFWTDSARRGYAKLAQLAQETLPETASDAERAQQVEARRENDSLRRKRLLNRLQHRTPDDRVGYSLFVFRLGADDVAALTAP